MTFLVAGVAAVGGHSNLYEVSQERVNSDVCLTLHFHFPCLSHARGTVELCCWWMIFVVHHPPAVPLHNPSRTDGCHSIIPPGLMDALDTCRADVSFVVVVFPFYL